MSGKTICWTMAVVDGDRARSIIREQNQMAHERLRLLLAEQGRHADTVAETLTPWIDRAWVGIRRRSPYGQIRPEALRVLQDACRWAVSADQEAASWWRGIFGSHSYPYFRVWNDLGSAEAFGEADRTFVREYIEGTVRRVRNTLRKGAKEIQEFQLPEQLLIVPDEHHPPRHALLEKGVLARLIVEDLGAQIEVGRALEASLAVGRREGLTTSAWSESVAEIMKGLTRDVAGGLMSLTFGSRACESRVVDACVLDRAYLSLGITYLEEVQERMSDYAEASGQAESKPGVSMNFSGGTFYGGQFAAQIANIDSTIAGVVRHGSPDMAAALKALEQAVLSQEDLDEVQRRDLLNNVGYLAEAAQAPPEKRNRGIVKSVLAALKVAAISGGELNQAMNNWGPILHKLLS